MKAYIAISHEYRPAPGVNTSIKGWETQPESMNRFETIMFLTRVRKSLWSSATTIVNVTDRRVEKNNAETQGFDSIMHYVAKQYPEHYQSFIEECIREGLVIPDDDVVEA